eukprot:CAMPEP_0172417880 /NCGR_PEP_ID=MMETSP1064-20121228/4365_1 /TAXON_ID=202472 /ORGANISM="Aulacoseira subarctica , Strain CCAP 1002/5" /LENGTH=172 /DNA_ID=CAMNT_0013156427 /DNA_START=249 /DNA_END=764 /DNA_ORIENTATION=+
MNKFLVTRDPPPGQTGFEYSIIDIDHDAPHTSTAPKPPSVVSDRTSTVSVPLDTKPAPKPTSTVPVPLDTKPAPKPTVHTDCADAEGYYSCLGTTSDFGLLMTQVWLIMNSYSKTTPNDAVSKLWLSWEQKGLTALSDFQQVKRITSIESLDQFYLYLQDCAPVVTVLDLKW